MTSVRSFVSETMCGCMHDRWHFHTRDWSICKSVSEDHINPYSTSTHHPFHLPLVIFWSKSIHYLPLIKILEKVSIIWYQSHSRIQSPFLSFTIIVFPSSTKRVLLQTKKSSHLKLTKTAQSSFIIFFLGRWSRRRTLCLQRETILMATISTLWWIWGQFFLNEKGMM